MSQEFQILMEKIAKIIEARTIILGPKKAKAYQAGVYHPYFSLIVRKGELMCIGYINRVRDCLKKEDNDNVLFTFRDCGKGLATDKDDPKGWDAVTLIVMNFYNLKM